MTIYAAKHKVQAVAKTRQEYNDFRGWILPEDENGDDLGYMIQFEDSEHYTWQPKEVFDSMYVKDNEDEKSLSERLEIEIDELVAKQTKLQDFIQSGDAFDLLVTTVQRDLILQDKIMSMYVEVLLNRFNYISNLD